jgi:ubiquinone/menaquinone biosynthesis C-methylase UbiE
MASHPVIARIYDRMLAANEKAGLRDLRADLLAGASGRTLEIGAGTGLNLAHYRAAVTELVLTEPDRHMAKQLRAKLAQGASATHPVEVVESGAEQLPFEDASFDTVVSTLVLCTVPDPERAVAEIQRVLRPGGRFLYIEHVRDHDGSRRARWQDRLERPWGWCAGGCHPNRNTGRLVAEAFGGHEPARTELPGDDPFTSLVKPLVRGEATRA